MRILKLFFLLLLLFSVKETAAQRAKPPKIIQHNFRHTSIGFGGGSAHYFGDLANYKYPLQAMTSAIRWNGTVDYTRHVSPWLSTRIAFSWIRIAGSDYDFGKKKISNYDFASAYVRNLHFRNDLKELSLSTIWNLVEQDSKGYLKRDRFIPYLFTGISLFHHDPKAKAWSAPASKYSYTGITPTADWVSLSKIGTEGQSLNATPTLITDVYPSKYSTIQASIPLGAGVRIRLSNNLDFSFEGSLNVSSTGYLDDVSGKYINPLDLQGDKTPFTLVPLPSDADFLPLTPERLLANPSRVPVDGYGGRDRSTDLANIDIDSNATTSSKLSTVRNYANNNVRGNGLPDSFLTFKVKLNYIIAKKVTCPTFK